MHRAKTIGLLAWFYLVPCQGQTKPDNLKPPPPPEIHNVRVLKSDPDLDSGTVKFRLEVTGQSLLGKTKKTSAKVSPTVEGTSEPELKGKPDPDFLSYEFEAEEGYRPLTVTLYVDDNPLDPFIFKSKSAPARGFEPTVYRSILDPKNVSDVFGRRIAKRFIALQITIINKHKDYQFIVHDVSLNLEELFTVGHSRLSARELSLLRGVAEKGQQYSPRNLTLRILRGVGNVAGGLVGLQVFGDDFPEATALFNGPTITAFTKIFPDFSIAQLIRLDDATYVANTVIPPRQSKVIVAFLPQRILLDESQRRLFWKDPTILFGRGNGDAEFECGYRKPTSNQQRTVCDLRAIEVRVDGSLVEEVGEIPPFPTSAVVDSLEERKFQNEKPEVGGTIRGRFLKGASLSIDEGASTAKNVSLSVRGSADENQIKFLLKSPAPISPGKNLVLRVEKEDGGRSVPLPISYDPVAPTLDSVEGDLAAGQAREITLKGSMFVPGITDLRVTPAVGIENVRVLANEIKANLTAPKETASGTEYQIKVVIQGNKESVGKKITVE